MLGPVHPPVARCPVGRPHRGIHPLVAGVGWEVPEGGELAEAGARVREGHVLARCCVAPGRPRHLQHVSHAAVAMGELLQVPPDVAAIRHHQALAVVRVRA